MSALAIPPRIKEAIRHDSLILFIGSGYSRNLSLPNWLGLARQFADVLAEKDGSLQTLREKARDLNTNALEILNALFDKGYEKECRRLLQETIDIDLSKCDLQNQRKIWQLSRKVVTTNYDRALEGALPKVLREDVKTYTPADNIFGLSYLRQLPYLLKIHGTIDRRDGCVLFKQDYDRLYNHNHQFLEQMKGICANSTILFIGYSIGDIELQQILRHIKSLFHRSTAHFTLTTDQKAFEPLGVNVLPLEDHDQLIPYIDALVDYRRTIEKTLRDAEARVALKYAGKKDLISLFSRDNDRYKQKENVIREEDLGEIRLLESLDSVDASTSEKMVAALIEAGHEDDVREFLLSKRYAKRQKTLAYFNHLENTPDDTHLKLALEDFARALKIGVELFARDDSELLHLFNELGDCHLRLGDLDGAEHSFGRALDIETGKRLPNPQFLWTLYANLGTLAHMRGNPNKALEYHQRVLELAEGTGERDFSAMRIAARSFVKAKRYREAIELLEQVLRDEEAPVLIRADDHQALGLAYSRVNRHRELVTCYEQALALFFDYYGKETANFVAFYNDIGYGYCLIQEYQKAIDYYKRALALEKNEEAIYITTNNLGEAYYRAGDFKTAKKVFEDNFAFLQTKVSESDFPDQYLFSRRKIAEIEDRLQSGR